MLFPKFLRFMRTLNTGKISNLFCVLQLGRVGLRIAEEYSSRFDLLEIDQCIVLSNFQTPQLEKAEKHLLNLVKKHDPLFSLMEYYDNYPYSYSDINYFFKACLKSGVEISIKVVNPIAKNNYFKKLYKLQKNIKYYIFFMPWLRKKYKIEEILKDLEINSEKKFDFSSEIKLTDTLQEHLNNYSNLDFLKRIRFSKLYSYLSSNSMIVREYTYGSYFYELLANKSLLYSDIIELIKAQLFFIFKVGVFHNNLHSGNIILSDEGNFHLLDCNTVSILKTSTRENLFSTIDSILKNDTLKIIESLKKLSTQTASTNNLEKEIADILQIKISSGNAITKKIMLILKAGIKNGLSYDTDIFSVFKSLIYLEKIAEISKNKNISLKSDFIKIFRELEKII